MPVILKVILLYVFFTISKEKACEYFTDSKLIDI
jgi:hypothetical protein